MGRPTLKNQDKKAIKMSIRCTEEEYKFFNDFSLKNNLSKLEIFQLGVGKKRLSKRSFLEETLLGELSRIGNNLNQISRVLNSEKTETILDLESKLSEIKKVTEMIHYIKQKL